MRIKQTRQALQSIVTDYLGHSPANEGVAGREPQTLAGGGCVGEGKGLGRGIPLPERRCFPGSKSSSSSRSSKSRLDVTDNLGTRILELRRHGESGELSGGGEA